MHKLYQTGIGIILMNLNLIVVKSIICVYMMATYITACVSYVLEQSNTCMLKEQLNECMDWAERLTMLEKRLRQKEAGLRNLEQTLQEMKMRLDRRQSELSRFEHQLDTKETVLKTAEHQLAISGAELAAHYKILNSREQEMDLPITSAPLVCAGLYVVTCPFFSAVNGINMD